MLKEQEILDLAAPTLQDKLGSFGFDHAEVTIGFDHDGDASIFMDAVYKGVPNVDTRASVEAVVSILDALRELGDPRFVYLRHKYPDDEAPIEDDFEDTRP